MPAQPVERLLDAVIGAAIAEPVPVSDPEEVVERLRAEAPAAMRGARSAGGFPGLPAGAVPWAKLAAMVAARSKRSLRFGRRAVPVAVATTMGRELVSSFRLGALELEVLASLLVNRLRAEGLPVDPRFVQRVTVNAYLDPARRHDVTRHRAPAAALLAGMWAGRVLGVEPAIGRVRKAAGLVASIDLPAALPGGAD
jgi:hypothetical protein